MSVPLRVEMPSGEQSVEVIQVFAPPTRLVPTASGENFDYEHAVEELPIIDRSIETVANNPPNVVPLGECSSCYMQVSGTTHYDNVTLLDGAEISDPIQGTNISPYCIPDAVEELQVQSGSTVRSGVVLLKPRLVTDHRELGRGLGRGRARPGMRLRRNGSRVSRTERGFS